MICEGPEQSSEESKPVTSVDLNESLNALVNESSDVIESILADEDTVVFTRENNKKPVQEPQEELPSLSLEVPAHDSVSSEE